MLPILKHELKYYFKNKQEAIYLYSYFLSILLLFPFSMRYAPEQLQPLGAVALWVALASGISLGAGNLFKRDAEQGRLEYYQLLPLALEGIMIAKWLAFLIFVAVPLMAILPLAALLFHLEAAQLIHYAVGLSLGATALSLLASLVAALTCGLEKAGAILSLIMLPLAIPIMIFGAEFCRQTGALWQPNLLFLVGFSIFLLPILAFAGAYSIRAGN